jgi:hypothetical protein
MHDRDGGGNDEANTRLSLSRVMAKARTDEGVWAPPDDLSRVG